MDGAWKSTWNEWSPVYPVNAMLLVAAVSGSWTVHGASPHSKSPLTTPAVAVGVQELVGVGAHVGPHLQAEMYLSGVAPQAEVALVG